MPAQHNIYVDATLDLVCIGDIPVPAQHNRVVHPGSYAYATSVGATLITFVYWLSPGADATFVGAALTLIMSAQPWCALRLRASECLLLPPCLRALVDPRCRHKLQLICLNFSSISVVSQCLLNTFSAESAKNRPLYVYKHVLEPTNTCFKVQYCRMGKCNKDKIISNLEEVRHENHFEHKVQQVGSFNC